jgi:hypothetical protein
MPTLMRRKQLLLITILQFLSLLNATAQEALCSWLSAETVESGRQYLFRRTFTGGDDAAEACATVAANGPFRLFINGMAVFTSYFPCGGDCLTVDVKGYIRKGENTVALWYAPDMTGAETLPDSGGGMFALSLRGRLASGKLFTWVTDTTWLCTPSNALSAPEGESEDATEYLSGWSTGELPVPMRWTHAVGTAAFWAETVSRTLSQGHSDCAIKALKPSFFDVSDDGTAVAYNFNNAFWGTFRITVRGAKAGERIWADGSEYVCRGVLDEQFIGRFVHKGIRKLVITGDTQFRKSHIVKVEGITLSPEPPVAAPPTPALRTTLCRIFL